ncbi:gfo/Idh/MocA family oxidoreductase [bacterium]|nr:gfo/Idh/MocA family oxidoreductase [bacterium]
MRVARFRRYMNEQQMSESRITTVNCIGLGHWGPNLIRAIAANPHARVHTVCDIDESRLKLIRRNIPSIEKSSDDPGATIDDPAADAVVIATPTRTHFELAKRALNAGKHVLVEKPLALDVREAEELADLADSRGLVLAVGHVFLFNKGVLAIRDLIRSGELGGINYIFSTRTNLGPVRTDCNALWDLASHDLSIIDFWLDAHPVSVTARGQSFLNPPIEDVVIANFTYPFDIMACVHASWLNPSKIREITVVGQKKMAIFDDMNLDAPVRIFSKSIDAPRESDYVDSYDSFLMNIVQHGDVLIPHLTGGEPVANQVNHFIDCILTGKTPVNSGRFATEIVRELAAAETSMKNRSILTPIE